MMSAISRFILRLFGWKITGWDPHQLNKYVIIVIPHTSNWDFPLGLLVRRALNADFFKFVGKDSLFRFPFGGIFRALGGYPVDRSKRNNFVDSVVDIFEREDKFAMTIAPEGTRSKVDRLKTGFYYIAMGAKVPIVMCKFDYSVKEVDFREPFYPTGDLEADMVVIREYFQNAKGKHPKGSFFYE
jgi:1-acyl-sn-glycerol-3-phosphate acyltransferase